MRRGAELATRGPAAQTRVMTTPARAPGDELVVHQSVDREGSTFALSAAAKAAIREKFGDAVNVAPRIFIAHDTRAAFEALHGDLAKHIIALLTGVNVERLAELGPVRFLDPVTDLPPQVRAS